MMYDDDALDRALAALPLEDPPANLHARVMAATVYRPRASVQQWEVWTVATLAALAMWLTWVALSTPRLGERLVDGVTRLIDAGGLTSLNTLMWLAVGISAAWCLSQITVPQRRRVQIR
jgi:hypothetical protein